MTAQSASAVFASTDLRLLSVAAQAVDDAATNALHSRSQ